MPKEQLGQRIICRQCSTELVAGPAEQAVEPAESSQPVAAEIDIDEEGLQPEPPPERLEVYKAALEKPLPPEIPHDDWVLPPEGVALTWAFFSGVFTFPWWPNAIGKWTFFSIFLSITGLLAVQIMTALASAWPLAVVLAIVASLVGVFAFSYGAACMVDIVVNTAYNNDKAADWPDVDWRDRLAVFVRVGYLLVFSIVPAAALASVLSLAPLGANAFNSVFAVGTFVLFPIIFLSSMEADSIWPLSAPTWRSLKIAWPGWLVFYAVSALLGFGVFVVDIAATAAIETLAPLVVGPFAAAALFIYARLLGRLAWFIRHGEGDDARLNRRYADPAPNGEE